MNDEMSFLIIFPIIFGILGIVFFIVGMVITKKINKREKNCTEKTHGTVINLVKHKSYDKDVGPRYSWHPVFEYEIRNMKYMKEYKYGSDKPKYEIGQSVELYYNPEDYNDFYIKGDTLPKTLGLIFTILGAIFLNISIFSGILMIIVFKH